LPHRILLFGCIMEDRVIFDPCAVDVDRIEHAKSMQQLMQGEIHVWTYNWQTDELSFLEYQLKALLSISERTNWQKLQRDEVRQQKILSRAFLRSVLSAYFLIPPQEWRIEYGQYGKPFIPKSQLPWPLCFNVSHAQNIIVCAVAYDGNIGIDIENVTASSFEEDCARNFAPSECTRLLLDKDSDTPSRFLDYWTLKEAYLKAIGTGLSGGLDSIIFDFQESGKLDFHFNQISATDTRS